MRNDTEKNLDRQIGKIVRGQRGHLHLSSAKVADRLGVTPQQLRRMEIGENRIGAGRLYQLAQILKVPPGYFFEGIKQ